MPNWYVIRDGADIGPFDDDGLRKLAMTDRLQRDELVRREGSNHTATAGDVKGLFPTPPPAPSSASSTATMPPESSAPISSVLFQRLKGAAKDVARAAAIKKLQLHDLPQADHAIGIRALQIALGGDDLAQRYAEIHRLEAEAATKQQSSLAPDHETMGDRAKRMAAEAKKRVDAELLLKKRKQCLIDVGRQIREGNDAQATPQLEAEIGAARAIALQITSLEAEDARQGNSVNPWRRLVIAGAAVPILLIGLWGVKELVTTSPEERHQATLEKIHADAQARQLHDDARRAEEDRRDREEQERQTAELAQEEATLAAKLARQKQETEAKRREEQLARKKARLLEEQEEADALAQREANQRAEAEREAAEKKREQLRLQEEHAKAQATRAELANRLFSSVSLDPNETFELSASARKARAKLELRSADLSQLQKLLADKDWLQLINHLNETENEEYPDVHQIERALAALQNHEFHLLVQIDRRYLNNDRGPQLCRIALPTPREHEDFEYPDIASVTTSWEVHPDGIGVTRPWKLTEGPTIIALTDYRRIDQGISHVRQQLGQRYLAMRRKSSLGEIDETVVVPEMRKAIAEAQEKLKAAALKL